MSGHIQCAHVSICVSVIMFMQMNAYMGVYKDLSACAHVWASVYDCVNVCMCSEVCACAYVCVFAYAYVYMHECIACACVHVCRTCACLSVCICARTYVYV